MMVSLPPPPPPPPPPPQTSNEAASFPQVISYYYSEAKMAFLPTVGVRLEDVRIGTFPDLATLLTNPPFDSGLHPVLEQRVRLPRRRLPLLLRRQEVLQEHRHAALHQLLLRTVKAGLPRPSGGAKVRLWHDA